MGDSRIVVFIPMYNCAPQVVRVLDQLRSPRATACLEAVICVDNRSTDGTAEAAAQALEDHPLKTRILMRNDDNYGLGGSHKVAIEAARTMGFTHLVVLHGDDQGAIEDALPHLEAGDHRAVDFLMGARFMPGSKLVGYSALRTYANKAFNLIFSAVSGTRLYDLGSGLNVFSLAAFDSDFHRRYADDLTFNYYLILGLVAHGHSVRFFPLTWREEDQVSNAKPSKMGVQILGLLWRRITAKRAFLDGEHRATARAAYPSTQLGRWGG